LSTCQSIGEAKAADNFCRSHYASLVSLGDAFNEIASA